MAATPVKKKAPIQGRDVFCGDSVYFTHPELGAQSGRVLSVGGDGIAVEHGGGTHGVLWEHLLGHKKRHARKLTLLERGEDGGIATDDEGKSVYVEGEIPVEDAPLNKAIEPPGNLVVVDALALRDQAVIDAALIGAGFEPSLDYIRKTYGEHWRLSDAPAPPTVDLEPMAKAIAEVRAVGDAAIDDLRTEFSTRLAALAAGRSDG